MPRYKNASIVKKTFHGVTFRPGETKEVDGYINDTHFIRVEDSAQTKSIKPTTAGDPVTPAVEDKKQGGKVDGSDKNK